MIPMYALAETDASVSNLAEQADAAYSAEDYTKAINLYKESISQEGTSSEIWYNLGNAYYRTDSLAKAILSYERALILDPTNEDARQNLEFVNTKIIDAKADNSSYSTIFIEKTMQLMNANSWAIITLLLFILLLGLIAGYIFSNSVLLRKIYFFGGLVCLGLTSICIAITISVASQMTNHNRAVIMSESARLSTSPSTPINSSQQAFLLHAGTVVTVLDSVATPLDPNTKMWYEVEVDNEHRAWIDKNDVEKI